MMVSKTRLGVQAEMGLLPAHVVRFIDARKSLIYPLKLLQPGWAGQLALEEAEYIAWHLARDTKLRRLWHIRRRKRYPLQLIAERAFPEDPAEARRLITNAINTRTDRANRGNAPRL